MNPANAASLPSAAPQTGALARLAGVFFEPRKTFTEIAQRPTWILPTLLVILSALGLFAAVGQRVGWDRVVRQRMQMSPRLQQLTPEQIALQVRLAPALSNAGVILGVPLFNLLEAAVLLGIAGGLMGARLAFKQVFAVVCYSGLPAAISSILAAIVVCLKNPGDFDLQNPLVFNIGAFLDPNGGKFLHSLASSMDLFVFWMIFLIATGLKAAAGKSLTFTGALVAVLLPWVMLVLGKAAFVAAFN
jgi:hypothetical protein